MACLSNTIGKRFSFFQSISISLRFTSSTHRVTLYRDCIALQRMGIDARSFRLIIFSRITGDFVHFRRQRIEWSTNETYGCGHIICLNCCVQNNRYGNFATKSVRAWTLQRNFETFDNNSKRVLFWHCKLFAVINWNSETSFWKFCTKCGQSCWHDSFVFLLLSFLVKFKWQFYVLRTSLLKFNNWHLFVYFLKLIFALMVDFCYILFSKINVLINWQRSVAQTEEQRSPCVTSAWIRLCCFSIISIYEIN